MAAQERSRKLSLTRFRCALAVRKVEVPSGLDQMADPWHQPFSVLRSEPEIEDPDRYVSMLRPDRQHSIAEQRKVTAIRPAGDQEPGGRHSSPTVRREGTLRGGCPRGANSGHEAVTAGLGHQDLGARRIALDLLA